MTKDDISTRLIAGLEMTISDYRMMVSGDMDWTQADDSKPPRSTKDTGEIKPVGKVKPIDQMYEYYWELM